MHGSFKRVDQSRTLHTKFNLVVQRELTQQPFAFRSQVEQYLAPVLAAMLAADIASRCQPIG